MCHCISDLFSHILIKKYTKFVCTFSYIYILILIVLTKHNIRFVGKYRGTSGMACNYVKCEVSSIYIFSDWTTTQLVIILQLLIMESEAELILVEYNSDWWLIPWV